MISKTTIAASRLIPEPKQVVLIDDHAIVYTGDDIQPIPVLTSLSVSTFRDRFNTAEMAALITLAYAGDSNIQLLLLKLQTTDGYVELNSLEVSSGLDYLVYKACITAARKLEILS